jgi:hypothetical protein
LNELDWPRPPGEVGVFLVMNAREIDPVIIHALPPRDGTPGIVAQVSTSRW